MEYIAMEIPLEMVPFEKMTKKDTKAYFEFYIAQINKRIEYLKQYIQNEGKMIEFDYSPNSLIVLWKWYEEKITVEEKTREELDAEISKHPEWMKDFVKKEKVSIDTLKIALDVSAYFAEVLIRNNNERIKWGYFVSPKTRMSVNQPVLLGFKNGIDLNPRLIVLNCTRKCVACKNERILFDMYNTWINYL